MSEFDFTDAVKRTIAEQHDRIAALEAENANLREYIERKRDLQHFARLVDQNSKLRELVADMLGYYAMPNNIDYKREAALLERARKLGIEVDE